MRADDGPPLSRLWRLLRPRGALYVLLLPILGFGYAHWSWGLPLRGGGELLWVLAAWASLHAGAMWLNAALDQDDGEVLMGDAVRPPGGTRGFAVVALVLAPILAWPAGAVAFGAALAAAALAGLYSWPSTCWKGHPVGGPAVNLLGYAVLSPLAGGSVVGVAPGARTFALWGAVIAVCFGVFAVAQAFQRDEDAARGYRTLVVTHGPKATLTAASAAMRLGLGAVFALSLGGWLPRLCLLALPAALAMDRRLGDWRARVAAGALRGGEADARAVTTGLARVGWALIAAAYADYLWSAVGGGELVAGLATARGGPG